METPVIASEISRSNVGKDTDKKILGRVLGEIVSDEDLFKRVLQNKKMSMASAKSIQKPTEAFSINKILENKMAARCIDTEDKLKTLQKHVDIQNLLTFSASKKMLSTDKKMDEIKSCFKVVSNEIDKEIHEVIFTVINRIRKMDYSTNSKYFVFGNSDKKVAPRHKSREQYSNYLFSELTRPNNMSGEMLIRDRYAWLSNSKLNPPKILPELPVQEPVDATD